eukprot:171878-Hanusia_phi.AAC.2
MQLRSSRRAPCPAATRRTTASARHLKGWPGPAPALPLRAWPSDGSSRPGPAPASAGPRVAGPRRAAQAGRHR